MKSHSCKYSTIKIHGIQLVTANEGTKELFIWIQTYSYMNKTCQLYYIRNNAVWKPQDYVWKYISTNIFCQFLLGMFLKHLKHFKMNKTNEIDKWSTDLVISFLAQAILKKNHVKEQGLLQCTVNNICSMISMADKQTSTIW